jgi:alpha-L-glutamate ligase-like protein
VRQLFAALKLTNWIGAGKHLRELGVLGMNRRNHSYISKYNARELFPIVDDKLKTKRLALTHGVTTPELLLVIDNQHDVKSFAKALDPEAGFCIKPAKGSGGKGILVIKQRDGEFYIRSNGEKMSEDEVRRHISNILSGLFSLGGAVDVAMIEALIQPAKFLEPFSFEGVPDIRVILFRGVPVMAMMRLACSQSHGKANLHQGAIGVGLDIASGKAICAVQKEVLIDIHPDTGVSLDTLQIPNWRQLLILACECYEVSGLGYLGVDLVMDEAHGPMLLELNARPGLSIQIANGKGLLPRLKLVEALTKPDRMSISDKLDFASERFRDL